jgi:catechol 2,3-dioxygenase-like lactoylglutathione lyase family enzyme
MKVLGLVWLGTRTQHFSELVTFYKDVMGLMPVAADDGFQAFVLPNADIVEVFDSAGPHGAELDGGAVAGFLVDDIHDARRELIAAGVEVLGEPTSRGDDYRWLPFRGPDGAVYELVEDRRRIGATGV